MQSVSPCSEQWARGGLTGERPSLPRDVTEGVISKEYHVNWSERENFDGQNTRSKYKIPQTPLGGIDTGESKSSISSEEAEAV